MDLFDLEFYELSMIADDPKKLSQLKEQYYDSDFDDWLDEFEQEQQSKSEQESLDAPDEDTINWSQKTRPIEHDDYEVSEKVEISDWEEVNE